MPREHSAVVFHFHPDLSLEEIDGTLRLSLMAAESLYGSTRLKLEPPARLNRNQHQCHIDITTEVGRAIASIFFGYARQEFGEGAIEIQAVRQAEGVCP